VFYYKDKDLVCI